MSAVDEFLAMAWMPFAELYQEPGTPTCRGFNSKALVKQIVTHGRASSLQTHLQKRLVDIYHAHALKLEPCLSSIFVAHVRLQKA